MRTGRALALLLVAFGVAGLAYVAAVEVALARAAPTPLETGLEARDLTVLRAPASALPDLRGAPEAPALVVLVNPGSLLEGERNALRAHVEGGGALWVLSPHPSRLALWDDASIAADAFPGFLYAGGNGSAPRLALVEEGAAVSALGFLALDLDGDEWQPVLTADATAFRDTNGNGRLDRGEPGGPFVVAARADVGEGRVLVMGVEDANLVPAELASALARGLRDGGVLVVADGARAGAWTGPGVTALGLAALPSGSLLAAALLLVAAGGLLALVLLRSDDEADAAATVAQRLAATYADRLRQRGRPEDTIILQSLQGDSPP